MSHVFISYSRDDGDMMRRVRDTLAAEGMTIWIDEHLTAGTPSWRAEIEKAIENASAMIVLLSPTAKRSEWVNNEIAYAQAHEIAIFPLLVRGDDRDAVPLGLITAQRVDVRTRFLAGMQALVEALHEHLERQQRDDQANQPVTAAVNWLNRGDVYLRFWTQLLALSRGQTDLFSDKPPVPEYHLHKSLSRSGFSLGYVLSVEGWASADLYIDTGNKQRNKAAFDALHLQQHAIENDFGATLQWLRLDNKRSSKVLYRLDGLMLEQPQTWAAFQQRMIDAMIRLDKAFRDRTNHLQF
jgi:hypothetical protein